MQCNTLDELLLALPEMAREHQAELAGRSALFLLETKQGRQAYISLRDGQVTVEQTGEAPDCTIMADEKDLPRVLSSELHPAKALMLGRVKVKGNPRPLLELIALLK